MNLEASPSKNATLKLLQCPLVPSLQEEPLTLQGLYSSLPRPSVTQAKDMAGKLVNPTVKGIYKAEVLSWDQHHITGKGKQPAQANKISTVKLKEKEPTFQSQQQQPPHQPLQAGDANAPGKRKQTC